MRVNFSQLETDIDSCNLAGKMNLSGMLVLNLKVDSVLDMQVYSRGTQQKACGANPACVVDLSWSALCYF